MKKTLYVIWDHKLVGFIYQASGRLEFQYDNNWLSYPARQVSISLPLSKELYSQNAALPFFAGLLPEENIRMQIAKNLGISTHNEFAMLSALGKDCAGALQIVTDIGQEKDSGYYEKASLEEIIDKLPANPLLAGQKHQTKCSALCNNINKLLSVS